MMKNLKYLSLAVIFLFACQKDLLEKSPIIGVTEDNFYKTEVFKLLGGKVYKLYREDNAEIHQLC